MSSFINVEREFIRKGPKDLGQRVHSVLTEMMNKQNFVPELYREITKQLLIVFSNLFTIDSNNKRKPVKIIKGNSERAVAKITQEDSLILPIMGLTQTTSESDRDRSRYTPVFMEEKLWSDKFLRAIRILSFAPTPVNIKFSLGIWAEYEEDLDLITEQLERLFNPSFTLQHKFNTDTKVFLVGEENLSDVIVGDAVDRVLKTSYILSVESYIPSPKVLLTSTGKIERIEANIELDTILEELESVSGNT